jgi:hypothetical protein
MEETIFKTVSAARLQKSAFIPKILKGCLRDSNLNLGSALANISTAQGRAEGIRSDPVYN